MDVNKYWSDLDSRLVSLQRNGYVKLPPLSEFELNDTAAKIISEMRGRTFAELCPSHELFLSKLNIKQELTPKLFAIASRMMGYKGCISDQYHIARRVEPGNSHEMYRAHFDSHIFTLVLPIKIPTAVSGGSCGELMYCAQARKAPRNELSNFIGKLSHKQFASEEGMRRFSENNNLITDDFLDYEPLLFAGRTTLHTNKPVSLDCSSDRLTLLAHFFDPSPRYGVGSLLRLLRQR